MSESALLDKVRDITGHALDLAWSPNLLHGVSAIDVYPAATLTAHRFRASGYKKPADTKKRQEIGTKLADELTFAPDVTLAMLQNADALDAVVCLLAAKDFLEGRAMGPIDGRLASQEGWIWCARV